MRIAAYILTGLSIALFVPVKDNRKKHCGVQMERTYTGDYFCPKCSHYELQQKRGAK